MSFNAYFQSLAKFFGKFFPAGLVSTFFGIGYLPAWQNHWSSVLSLVLFYITFYLIYGLLGNDFPTTALIIAVFALKISMIFLVVNIISIFIFQTNNSSANSNDIIVSHIACGQILVIALSMPAIIEIYYQLVVLYDKICNGVFMCPIWVNNFMYFLIFFFVPFVFFNIVDSIKPWPISTLQLTYNNCFSITLEGLIYVFYTVIFMYMVAFILCDLTIIQAVTFNKYVFKLVNELGI